MSDLVIWQTLDGDVDGVETEGGETYALKQELDDDDDILVAIVIDGGLDENSEREITAFAAQFGIVWPRRDARPDPGNPLKGLIDAFDAERERIERSR